MILVGGPMALLAHLRRDEPPPNPDGETVARLRSAIGELDPDPLFRRRLRGTVLNGYVELREGMRPVPPAGLRAGSIGRAALSAGAVAALAATAVAAMSNDALPGDPLYGAKIAIEHVRMELAPAGARLQLAEASFDERLNELERLASNGDWTRAAESARAIAADFDQLRTVAGTAGLSEQSRLEHRLTVLTTVLEEAPPSAREGLQRAIAAPAQDPGQQPSIGTQAAQTPAAARSPAATPSPTAHPARTPNADHSPHPDPSGH